MKDINSFLADQRTGLFDSTGEFTIAADKALEKLAASQLSDPSMWVLKIVQFAACFGVEDVNFVFDRRVTRVTGRLPRQIALHEFQKGLDRFEPLENRAFEYLVVALRALGSFPARKFAFQLSGPDDTQYLIWDGKKLNATSRPEKAEEAMFCLEATSSRAASWLNPEVLSVRARETKYLYDQALPAPFMLAVDGMRLTGRKLRTVRGLAEPVWADFVPREKGFPLPRTFDDLFRTAPLNARSPEIQTALSISDRLNVSAFWDVVLPYKIEHGMLSLFPKPVPLLSESKLHWVMDGIVVDSEPLSGSNTPFNLQLFVDASGCPTDIGGHKFRESQAFEERRKWSMELIAWIGEQAKRVLPSVVRLTGETATMWNSLTTALTHMPINQKMEYQDSGVIANSLSETRAVRKALLERIRSGQTGLENLGFSRKGNRKKSLSR